MTLPSYAMSQASFPERYERFVVGPLFVPWVHDLLDRAEVSSGHHVLDVACGTGVVARFAFERVGAKGRVVGIDLSPQMLEVARSITPGVDWREGDAARLPVGDEEKVDAVVCQQGLQFFSDKPAAVREMYRVLRPGGRLAASTWLALEDLPFFLDLHRVGERQVGAIRDARFGLGDGAALARLFEDAGFGDVRVVRTSRKIRFAEPETFVRMNAMAIVGMSGASAGMSAEERVRVVDTLVAESGEVVSRYLEGKELVADIATNVASARR